MNWKRIGTGTVVAGIAAFGAEFFVNEWVLRNLWSRLQFQGFVKSAAWFALPALIFRALLIGFFCAWLYAFARPRFGPGPKTAFLTGSIIGALVAVPVFLNQWLWMPLPLNFSLWNLGSTVISCWVGSYLAGWQYIERAP